MTQKQIIADKLYDDDELAAILGLPSAIALNRARARGDAPPYVRLTYRRRGTLGSTMLAWLKAREHASPSAELAAAPDKYKTARETIRRATEERLARVRARKSGQAAAVS
jgi:hypothetical protein